MGIPIAILFGTLAGGGLERAVLNITRGLTGSGFTPHLFCLRARGQLQSEFAVIRPALREIRLRFWNMPLVIIKATRELRDCKAVLVHSNGYHADIIARLAAYLVGIPCVSTLHNNPPWKMTPKRPMDHWMRFLDVFTARLCGGWYIALSESIRDFHIQKLGYPDETWRIIPNPVDQSRLARGSQNPVSLRVELGVGPDELLCLSIGNLRPIKGHAYLLEAISLLPEEVRSRIQLRIVGEGPGRAHLEDLGKRFGLGQRLTLMGYREDIGPLLQATDIFVMPSLSEGQSIAILEAMMCSKPLIVTTQGAHMDYLHHAQNALLVPPGDSQSLADMITLLGRNANLRAKLGEAAAATVAMLPIANAVGMIEEFYAEIIERMAN